MSIFSFLGSLLLWVLVTVPSIAHDDDLSVAEIMVGKTQTQITLTFPTDLVAFADENRDDQLSVAEFQNHATALEKFLSDRLILTDSENNKGSLSVKLSETIALPSNLKATVNTHSTLLLVYTWLKPIQGLKLNYNLFLPGEPESRCLATIFNSGRTQNFIFSPQNQEFSLISGTTWYSSGNFLLAIAGAFFWGATHALSPGHGKTIVGAYLVGSRATPQHAWFLGLNDDNYSYYWSFRSRIGDSLRFTLHPRRTIVSLAELFIRSNGSRDRPQFIPGSITKYQTC
ncbi:MAG: hypothetical protein U7123_22690 [Potamolinea sp.]